MVRKKNEKWRDKNPGYDINYRKKNKEEIKLRNRKWRQNNPLKYLEIIRRYRAKKLDVNEKMKMNREKTWSLDRRLKTWHDSDYNKYKNNSNIYGIVVEESESLN